MHTCTALTVSNEEWQSCNSSEVQTSLQKPKYEEESLDPQLGKTLLQNCWEDRKHIAGLSGNFSTTLKLLKPLTLAAFSALSTYQIIQKMKSFLRSDITLLKRFNEMKTHFLKKKNPRDSSFRHFGISSLCGLTNTLDDEIICLHGKHLRAPHDSNDLTSI